MSDILNVSVVVLASFRHGQLRPQVMQYGGRTIRFATTTLVYAEGEGEQRAVYCTVSADTAVYTLVFYPYRLTWRLLTITDEDIYQDG